MTDASSPWQTATVRRIAAETPTAKTFGLELERPARQRAGQHYVVRLTAPDGYVAQRSYSVASAPNDRGEIDLTVERLADGEVSTYLHDIVEVGDELEVRGPIGGWFVWDGNTPALLVGGGSGIVPLMAMVRQARDERRTDLVRMIVSVRAPADLYYRAEVNGPETRIVYTRVAPPGSERPAGRLTATDLTPLVRDDATVYVCGSPAFADGASEQLLAAGVHTENIRVERFGPSG